MINESDLEGRAGQPPELQFRYIEQLAAKRRANDRDDQGNLLWDDFDYMSYVQPAAEAFGIVGLSGWELPSRGDEYCMEQCSNFRAEATLVSVGNLYRYATIPERDPNTVALDPETKRKLRFHLEQIHTLIDNEQLSDAVKEELHNAVRELEAEFDKARTHIGTLFEVWWKVWEGSKTIGDALRTTMSIALQAKKDEREKAALAAPPAQKQLPAPKSAAPAKKSANGNGANKKLADDEIPF